MPFGDRTGPEGKGPMTGRKLGYCADFGQPGLESPIPGRKGRGDIGRGRRCGVGWRWFAPHWRPR